MTHPRSVRIAPLVGGVIVGLFAVVLGFVAVPRDTDNELKSGSEMVVSAQEGVDAHVACVDGTTALNSQSLLAASDGVHVRVWSDVPGQLLYVTYPAGGLFDSASVALDVGFTDFTALGPPGEWLLGCFSRPFDPGLVSRASLSKLSAVDSRGYYRPAVLDCSVSKATLNPLAWGGDTNRLDDDLVAVATSRLHLGGGDSLDSAYYSGSLIPEALSVNRHGETIALIIRWGGENLTPSELARRPIVVTTCDGVGVLTES